MYDVLCAGLVVANLPLRPVDPGVFDVDVTQVERIDLLPGGDAVNQSIILSRLGLSVALLGRKGKDALGTQAIEMVAAEGVDISHLAIDPELNTSTCVMLIRADGRRNFCTYKGAMGRFCFEDVDLSLLDSARFLSIGGLMALPAFDRDGAWRLLAAAREKGVTTIVDTKYDTYKIGLAGIAKALPHIDYFVPSFEEASYLADTEEPQRIADTFMEMGAGSVVIKLGERGCYLRTKERGFYLPALPTSVVDTTGAGDNFVSGFIKGLSLGWEIEDCGRFATATGALCVQKVGPTSAVADMTQVRAFLADAGITLPQ